jgi:DNA-directed RNA polymerase specialized sigma24 family protein
VTHVTPQRSLADDPPLDAGATFDMAIAEHGRSMYGLAVSITGNLADAEDAYQAALEQAWRRWEQLKARESTKAWLAAICARSALRNRRLRARWLGRHVDVEHAGNLGTVMRWDPSLGQAMSVLTARQRAVVALHYGHGYSLDEVGTVLGCSGGAVRSHLHRALEHLRRELSDED